MLLVLFNVENDSTSHRHLGKQVEVSQNEKDLATILILQFHELLVSNQIIVCLFRIHHLSLAGILLIMLLHVKL